MAVGITGRLAAFAVNTSFADIPWNVINKSKEMMINAAAVGLAGASEREGQIIAQYVQQLGGIPVCTLIGAGIRSSPVNAALANGVMVHLLDYDEATLRRVNHPSSVIFPTVMALGEQMALPGKDVVAAFAIGCEVSTKIGAAGDLDELLPRMRGLGWQVTSVAGIIGAAAAAGKLVGLSLDQMENALGIAVAQASGVHANQGTPTKPFQCGHAAMGGVMAAMLAQKGFTAARDAIEDIYGFFGCYRRDPEVNEDEFIRCLGNPYDMIEPGVCFKLYPLASASHACVDAVLQLAEEYKITPEQVRSVRVAITPQMSLSRLTKYQSPETGVQGKFSYNYCTAVALMHGRPLIHHFTDEAVKDPHVWALLDKVSVERTEQATREVSRPVTVTISLTNGHEVRCRVEHAKGHPANPLTAQELEDKFRYCSSNILSPAAVTSAIDQFWRLEELADVRPLFSTIGGSEG